MRTREENSPDWIQIGEAFRETLLSIRDISRQHGVSDTAVRKRAKKEGWTRPDGAQTAREPRREPEREPPRPQYEAAAKVVSDTPISDLTKRGRNLILALMDELEFLNGNHQTLAALVEDYVNGEKDATVRNKLMRCLDHDTRAKSANQLATALAKLNDAAPGKKEQAKADAEAAMQDSGWGDDLDLGGARPN